MMKRIAFIGCFVSIFISCQSSKEEKKESVTIGIKSEEHTPFDIGEALFNGKGRCYSCHKAVKKSIGPSTTEIIKVYAEKKGDLIGFLKQQEAPIVDPENYGIMKTNFALLKTFSDQELEALVAYMNQITKH